MPAKTFLFQLFGRCRGPLHRSPSRGLDSLLLFGCLLFAGPLYGFDIVADFSTNANPNGVWSYGWETNAGGPFQLMVSNQTADSGLLVGWQNGLTQPNWSGLLKYFGTNADSPSNPNYPDDLHLDPQSHAVMVRFTAPSNGTYQIDGLFRLVDTGTRPHDLLILSNSIATNFHVLTAYGQFGAQFPFAFTSALNQNDTLDFMASLNGNFAYLSTGLKGSITPANGITYTWTGAASGDWSNPANWTPQNTPGGSDTVLIGTGGSPIVSNAASVGAVILSSGATLNAQAGLTISNLFNWDGGGVAGALTIGANATLNLNSPATNTPYGQLSMTGATIINNGTVVWDGGTLVADSNTVVINNGLWLAQMDDLFSNPNGGSAVFDNYGTFAKSPTTGASTFSGVAFNNAGAVTVGSGAVNFGSGGVFGGTLLATNGSTILLSGGGVLSGVFTAAPGSSVVLNGGTFTNAKAAFAGGGSSYMTNGMLLLTNDVSPNLVLAGGLVFLGPQFQASGAITNLTLAGATLTGTNTVAGTLAWQGGEIDGVLTINNGGVLDLNGSATLVQTAALTNAGQIFWRGSSDWYLYNPGNASGGLINNLADGVIDVFCDQTMYNQSGSPWIDNSGIFRKSQGRGVTKLNVLFTNAGVVEVLNGSLTFNQPGDFGGSFSAANGAVFNFNGGGVLSGSFSTGFGATLNLAGGAFFPTSGVSFGGVGTNEQTGGTLTLLNDVIPNLIGNGGSVELAPGFQNGSINNLTLNNQTLEGANTVTGTLTLGGASTVAGPLTVASNGVLNIDGNSYAQANLTNAGTVNWNAGYFQVQYGSGIYNLQGAAFNINLTSGNYMDNNYGSEFFNNAGLLQKSTNSSSVTIYLILTNSGTVDVQGGTLVFGNSPSYPAPLLGGVFLAETNAQINFNGGGALTGLYNATTTGVIELTGGAFTYGAIPTFAGAGLSEMTGGSLTLVSNVIPNLGIQGGTITLGPSFQGGTITNLNLNGATLVGTNIVTGVLSMSGGDLYAGALTLAPYSTLNWGGGYIEIPLTVPANAVMNITGSSSYYTYLYSPLSNAGTVNWTGGDIYLESSVAINNLPGGTFNSEGGYVMGYSSYYGGSFINAGSFIQTNTSGTTYLELPFNNLATVNVASGTLAFYDYGSTIGGNYQAGPGGTIDFGSGGYLTGNYTALPGGTINLSGGVFSNAPSMLLTGGGGYQLDGGTITLVSNVIPNLQYTYGTVNLSPSFQGGAITNLTLNGASLSGANVVTGTLTMNGGDISGPLTVAGNAVLTLTGPNTVYIYSALTNAGTIDWMGGSIYLDSTNALYNFEGALFSIQCDQYLYSYEVYNYYTGTYTYAPFINYGTITKTNATGTTSFDAPLNNAGTVNVDSGVINLNEGGGLTGLYYTAQGAAFNLTGGSFTNTLANTLFTGPGSYAITGGSLYLAGDMITNLLLEGGDIYLLPGFQGGTITNLTLNGAILEGANTVTGVLNMTGYSDFYGPLTLAPNSVFNYGGGYFEYPVTISNNAVMNITGPNYTEFEAPCTNQGTINWTGGTIYLYSSLYNLSNAVFSIQCDQDLYDSGTIYNAGLIVKTNTFGATYENGFIANTGTVDVESGQMLFGESDGLIGGTWQVGISGLNSYGQFVFENAAVLTNVLNLNLENGLLLAPGDSFTPVTYYSEIGVFSAVNFLPPQGANTTVNYTPTNLTIAVSSVVGPVISINSPTNYQTFYGEAPIPIQVAVSDADTTVLMVQYYQGNTFIGSSVSGPAFPIMWYGASVGLYTLTAVATDAAGAVTTSAPVPIVVYPFTEGRNYVWTGNSSANWSDSGNWSPAGVPGAGDNAFLNSGVINLNDGFSVNNVILNGGVLGGTGFLTVNGGLVWTGGVLNSAITVGPGATLQIEGLSPLTLSNATLINLGTAFWMQGDILAVNGVIANEGSWTASGGSNVTCLASFLNSGLVEATNGATLNLSGGGTLDGSFTAAAGANINFSDGSFDYGANPVFGGNGAVSLTGGGLTLTNTVSPNLALAGGSLFLGPAFQNGGAITNLTLSGSALSGSNVVTGVLNLTGGSIYGQLTVTEGGSLNFFGPQYMYLESATLLNFGRVNWLGGEIYGDSDAITNNNLWLIESDNDLDLYQSTFVNNGTVQKLDSVNTTYFSLDAFVNNGTVDAESGHISLNASGALAGAYQTGSSGEIDFAGANMTLAQFPAFTGNGSFDLTGGMLTILSNVPPGFALAGGTVALGPGFQANGAITNLTLAGATLAGSYTVTGVLNFAGGAMSDSLTIAAGATLNLMGPNEFDVISGALTNLGTVQWSGGDIGMEDGTVIVNDYQWVAQSDNMLGYYCDCITNAAFINNGAFLKQGTTGYTEIKGIAFNNAGTVDAETGTIDFEDGGQIAGTYNTAGQAAVDFSSGAYTAAAPPGITGGGTVQLDGGSLALMQDQIPGLLLAGGTVTLGPAFQSNGAITNLTIQGATLAGSNLVTGTLNFGYGNIDGWLTVATNGTMVIGSNYPEYSLYLESGALTNFGTVLWSGDYIEGGLTTLFVNNGLWLAQGDNDLEYYYYNTSAFLNNGVFRKLGGTGYTYVSIPFINNGQVDAETGTVYFDDGGQIGGNYISAPGTAIYFAGGSFTNATPAGFAGPGAVELYGTLTLLSDQIPSLPLNNGTLILGPAFQNNGAITNLTLSGAALQGSNLVTGTLNWTAGYLSSSLTVAPGGVLNISSTAQKELYINYYNSSSLVNFGTVVWSGGELIGTAQTAVTNNGLWLVQTDSDLYSYSQNLIFVNNGTFRKTTTAGTTYFYYVTFINSGTLDVESGTVNFPSYSAYEQTVATLSFGASAPSLTGQLTLSSVVNLDGALTLNLLNGYTPVAGDVLKLITYPSAAGSFANFNLPPLGAGLNWQTEVGSAGVLLRVVRSLASANTLGLSGTVTDINHQPIAGAIVYAAITSATATNLIQNGSFESPNIGSTYLTYGPGSTNIPGWTVTGSPGSEVGIAGYYWEDVPAEDGNQYLDVTGDRVPGGGITQTFSTIAGASYDLIFYHGSYNHYGINNALGVTIAGNSYAYGETSAGNGSLDWRQVVIPFVATSNFTTLAFTNLTGFYSEDNFVDNAQVVPPDFNRVLQTVTASDGSYQIPLANETFQVGVSGLAAFGYNDIPAGPVAMNGTNQVTNFVATPLSLTNTGPFTITTSASPPDAGTTAGDGTNYANGASVTVTATVTNAGFVFSSWTENGYPFSTNASYTFTATRNRALVANFSPLFSISTAVYPSGGGSVVGGGTYASNASVTVTATPNAGFAFTSWTENGVVQSTSASYTFTVTTNRTLVANFYTPVVITTAASPPAGGITGGGGTYASGASVTVTAAANAGFVFISWTENGVVQSTSAGYTFIATNNRALVANFLPFYSISASANPPGAGTIGGAGTYASNAAVTVTATTNAGFFFVSWTENGVVQSTDASYAFTATRNRALVANFLPLYPVLLNISANLPSPVPATTNFVLRLQFDRTMNTAVAPTVLLTNAAAGASQPVVAANGSWSTVSSSNDTYSTPPITIASNMDGTVQVWVSGATDYRGDQMVLTNPTSFIVRISPPVVAISAPANGFSCTTTDTFNFTAGASSGFGIASLSLYANGTNLAGTTGPTNFTATVSDLAAGSYRLTAVAVDNRGLASTSRVTHITVNIPGTYLIDFEGVDASTNAVSGDLLANYLSGYGITLANVTSNTTVAVQNDMNIARGNLTVAQSGDNLLTQSGANGLVSYTLVFNQPYKSISWWRTELLAGPGIATPAWQATAYDANSNQVGLVREQQVFSSVNLPAKQFSLSAPAIMSVTFTGNNSIGSFDNLPLDDLLLSIFPSNAISVSLSANNTSLSAPGQVTLTAQASEVNASISEIDFYEGQNLIGGAFGSPAALALQNLAPGTYSFTAVATDNNGAVRSSTPVTVTVNTSSGVSVINFDSLDTSSGAVGGADLSNYLAGFGLTLTNVTQGTRLEADKGNDLSRGALADPSSPLNLFTQVGLSQPAPVTFTLAFANPVQSFGFTRVGLTPGSSLALHPAWTAHAFDASGTELESVSEPLIPVTSAAIPARVFQLAGANITSVRFDSDPQGSASFAAVLLDDLVLETNAASNALSITLSAPGNLTAPANFPLTASVQPANGSVDHVNFYLGPALLSVASSSPYSAVYSNALPGSYTFTAQVVDTNGYAKFSAPVQVTVAVGANSTNLNFDSLSAPATGAALTSYFAAYGITVTNLSPDTTLSVLSQAALYGGGLAPPTNVLTQTGSNGPVSFTLLFSNLLTQFSFTRPQLTANPSVSHPAWQVQAFDALGVPLAQAQEGLISSSTNVPAATFTLQSSNGIAGIAFESEGNGFATFNAMLLENFTLTVSPVSFPPSVLLTNPLPGQVYAEPGVIPLAASAVDPGATIAGVSFYANASNIGSASSSPYSISWTNSATGPFALTAVAANNFGLSRSSPPVNISVVPAAGVFGISGQPIGQTVALGGSMVFDVAASGSNLTYQWNQNNLPLPNQSSNVLVIAQVGDDDAGNYTVTVASGGQSITSQVAVLTVLNPPGITAQPQSVFATIGGTVTLSVGASGAEPFSYQWTLNGTGIAGATNSTYVITNAQPLSSGNYYAIVANSVGLTNSALATVVVTNVGGYQSADNFSNRISINPLVSPVIGNNLNATREPGEPLHDGKPGGKSIWYTWHASFTGVVSLTTLGSTFDTLLAVYTGTNVANLTLVAADDDSGGFFTSLVTFNCVAGTDYQIAVDGFQGAAGTVVLGLPAGTGYRVLNPASGDAVPSITQQPTNQVVPAGSTVTLSVSASSVSPLTYQWSFQNMPVAGASNSQFVISNFLSASVGNYSVLVANNVGSVPSAIANIQVIVTNNTGTPSGSAQDKFGDAVDLSQSAGTDSVGRREDSGGDVRGFSVSQTFSTVGATKEAAEPNPAGQSGGASEWYIYTTQEAGTLHLDTSGSAFNTILAAYTNSGSGAPTFATLVEVVSGFTTNYQKDGQPSLDIPNVPAGLTFYVVVDGYNGVSGMAHLNIGLGVPPTIGSQPQSSTNAPGQTVVFSVLATGTTNLFYQWQFDSANIGGATAASYTNVNVRAGSVGSYTVIISNVVGVVTSAPAVLTLQSVPFILAQPASTNVSPGQTASFSVTAGGVAPLSYQWYFNSAGIAGATNTSYTIPVAQGGSAGSYTVVVTNSFGAVTSAPAVLVVQGAPFIVRQPAGINAGLGQTATFSVTAGGVPPFFYQWYFNGKKIPWATNSTFTLPSVLTNYDGSFSVVVRNSSGSVTSADAVLIVENEPRPTVAISSPANNSTTTAASVTVKGTAAGKAGITLVQLVVNSNLLGSAAGSTSWSRAIDLLPGTNRITATSFDANGVASAPVTHSVFRKVVSTLTLLTNGPGGILGEANGAALFIGRGYTVTGVPKPSSGFLFSNWMSGDSPTNLTLLSESPVLNFIMSSNLVLQASFGPNPFTNVAGAYNGLFPTNFTEVTESSSGFITANLTASKGAYSARLLLDGGAYPFSGSFSLTGDARHTINRSGKSPVTVFLHLDVNTNPPDNLLTGSVSNAAWVSPIYGERAVFNAKTDKATAYAGKYTLIIPPGPGAPQASPGGYGAAMFTNNLAGVSALAGHLGDGAAISQSVPISQYGDIPVYISLYSGKGSLWGWLTFSNIATNTPPQTLSGDVSWIKTPLRAKPFYTNGFIVQTNVLASVYVPANTLPPTNYTLTISNASQGIQLVYSNLSFVNRKFTNNAALTNPTNKLSVTFAPATGVMTVTFHPTGAPPVTATGVVLQDQAATNGAGWFLGRTNSGYFLLQQ
ncbi:MAG: immunoglobulin domain-containing protein [Verrucomicrobiota bacterium]|jgi:hypothetical protein